VTTIARRVTVSLALALATVVAPRAEEDADTRALAALVQSWAAARSANDIEAMRPLFAADVDHVRLSDGTVLATDQAGLLKWFDTSFRGDGKGTTARIESHRERLLSDAVGLADYTFTLHDTGGRATLRGHVTFVCQKQDGTWKVSAVRFASAPIR
jgi:uncharacterized protein (TIGR02246 family)